MSEKYFFNIPVYRLPKERYYEELDVYVNKVMFPGPPQYDEDRRTFNEKYPEQKRSLNNILKIIMVGHGITMKLLVG